MKTQKLFFLLLISTFIISTSCKKDGETGPQGEPGTANVIYSDWFQYTNSSTSNNLSLYQMVIADPQISQDFINKGGTVLVFMGYAEDGKTDSVRQILSLPTWGKQGYKNEPSTDAVYYDLGYIYEKDLLSINFIITQGLNKIIDGNYFFNEVWIGSSSYFRYILIPGGVNLNNRIQSVDYNNYEAVKAYYSIPD